LIAGFPPLAQLAGVNSGPDLSLFYDISSPYATAMGFFDSERENRKMSVSGTIKDSQGQTWQWVSQGDSYGLQLVRGREFDGIVGPAPTVNWRGDRWCPDSLRVGEDGRVISGAAPGGDWGV
jgi:hypothetical protein